MYFLVVSKISSKDDMYKNSSKNMCEGRGFRSNPVHPDEQI